MQEAVGDSVSTSMVVPPVSSSTMEIRRCAINPRQKVRNPLRVNAQRHAQNVSESLPKGVRTAPLPIVASNRNDSQTPASQGFFHALADRFATRRVRLQRRFLCRLAVLADGESGSVVLPGGIVVHSIIRR